MKRQWFFVALLVGAMLAAVPGSSVAAPRGVQGFVPLASFAVPGGGVAEIVSATPDGNTAVYTNAGGREVGIVNLSDPVNPVQVAAIPMPGEPTSVSVSPDGALALVAVITSVREEGEAPVVTPGQLVVVNLATLTVAGSVPLGAGPDSVASTFIDGTLTAVVAIENEPMVVDSDGKLTDEDAPGEPNDISGPGLVQVVTLNTDAIASSTVTDVTFDVALLARAGLLYPDDPQPEFVELRNGKAAVTLQENNGVAIIDVASTTIERVFSTGVVADRPADLTEDNTIAFTQQYPSDVADAPYAGARVPDAVAWSADGTTLYTADEGEQDFTGGRGWSVWSARGTFLRDDGGALEAEAVARGMYPDGRSENKGIEAEGIETAVYGGREFAFVGSERGSFVAVYDLRVPHTPRFVQLLPTGISPEGLLAIPSRNLFLTSDEVSGTITVFEAITGYRSAPNDRPILRSSGVGEPWGALSGLAASRLSGHILYAVPDDALPSAIYRILLVDGRAKIGVAAPITKDGEQARYDLEGIAIDTSIDAEAPLGGYWLASEGNAAFGKDDYRPNLLIQVDLRGRVLQEIALPAGIDAPDGGLVRGNGFEGVTLSDDGRYLVAALQRGYADDEANNGVDYTRIARYDLVTGEWNFFLYPLEPTTTESDWIGLSEITNLGGNRYAVIERDKQIGGAAAIKRVYTFTLDGVLPFDGLVAESADLSGHVVQKDELVDLLPAFTPFEKIEGLTLARDGALWAALDNDGGEVEPRLVNMGRLSELE